MNTYTRFLYEFLSQFFLGFKNIFMGLFNGIKEIFNFPEYKSLIDHYRSIFETEENI